MNTQLSKLYNKVIMSKTAVKKSVSILNCFWSETAAWKKSRFILSARLDFHMIDGLSIKVHSFAR